MNSISSLPVYSNKRPHYLYTVSVSGITYERTVSLSFKAQSLNPVFASMYNVTARLVPQARLIKSQSGEGAYKRREGVQRRRHLP